MSRTVVEPTRQCSQASLDKVKEVVLKLNEIQDECRLERLGAHDGLACFDFLYTIITTNILDVLSGLDDDPVFHDNEFMATFDVAFADRYLDAVGCSKTPTDPACWRTLLTHREDPGISPLIFAVAGVNAHINYDLPFAVVAACVELDRELNTLDNHEDYQLINWFFFHHMQQLRQHFESQFERDFDKSFVSWIENKLGDWVVVFSRDRAWKRALKIWEVRDDPAAMARLAASRDRWVALLSNALFALDHIANLAFKAMYQVPGPTRRMATKSLARTGWEAEREHVRAVEGAAS